ncbi:MAG: CPBP family intramembrane metalloprotease [bacterium]|nr:CPBP family intramembrane metalloprotease [bacterium]
MTDPKDSRQIGESSVVAEGRLHDPRRRLAWIAVLVVVGVHLAFALLSGNLGASTGAGNAAALGGTLSSLVLVFVFQRALGLEVGEFGLRRPASWPRVIALGVLVALVSGTLAQGLMAYVISPLISAAPPDVTRFDAVRGNLSRLLMTVPTVWLTSAFPEEVIWRGFLMTRIAKLVGGSSSAWALALVLTSLHFGLIHFYQGVSGMAVTGIVGLLYGGAFLIFGRNLWVPIVAHAATHLISFTAMYMGFV